MPSISFSGTAKVADGVSLAVVGAQINRALTHVEQSTDIVAVSVYALDGLEIEDHSEEYMSLERDVVRLLATGIEKMSTEEPAMANIRAARQMLDNLRDGW